MYLLYIQQDNNDNNKKLQNIAVVQEYNILKH